MTSDFFKNLQKNKELAAAKSAKDNLLAAKYLDSGCDKDEKKDSKGAIEDYSKAIKLNPNYAEAYANRGCAKEELGDKKGALADWYKALALGDKESESWIRELKDKYVMTPELQTAQKRFEELAEKSKRNGSNWLTEQVQILQPEELNILIKLDKEADAKQVAWFNKNPGLIAGGERHINLDLTNDAKEEYSEEIKKYSELIKKLELDYFKSKYAEQLQEFIKTWNDDDEVIFWEYEEGEGGRFCYKDSEHGGCVYVPKRCILADPSFYKLSEWEDATDEELEDLPETFREPIMIKQINRLYFADEIEGLESGFVDNEYPELEAQKVKYEDVIDPGGISAPWLA